jgi:hypothetical protein
MVQHGNHTATTRQSHGSELMSYWPTTIAALRTCKSGVLVGTAPDVEAAAAAAHPGKWLTGGLYGVVQLAPI